MSSFVTLGLNLLRTAVSGRRNRFQDSTTGDDLDLTYITPRIIAMAFPASDLESFYRNNISDVARCLDRRHKDAYLVVNLSERHYDNSFFDHRVLPLGFPDHYAPPVEVAWTLCITMDGWLRASPTHVAVVHCLAGKGRTGAVIACYLLFSGYFFAINEIAKSQFIESSRSHRGGGGGEEEEEDAGVDPFAAILEDEKKAKGITTKTTTNTDTKSSTNSITVVKSDDSSKLIALVPPHELARLALAHFRGRRGEGVKYPSQERTVRYFAHVVHAAIVSEHNRLVGNSSSSLSSTSTIIPPLHNGEKGVSRELEEGEGEEKEVTEVEDGSNFEKFTGKNPLRNKSLSSSLDRPKEVIRWVRRDAAEIIRSMKNLPLLNRTIVKVNGVRIVGIPRVTPSASSDGAIDFAPTVLITSAPFQGRETRVIYSSSWHSPITKTYSSDKDTVAVFNFDADLEGDVLFVLRHGVSISDDSRLGTLVFGGGGAGVVGSGKEVLRFSFHSAFISRESVSPGIFRLGEKDVDMEKKSKAAFSLPRGFYIDLLYSDIVEEGREKNDGSESEDSNSTSKSVSPLVRDRDILCSGWLIKRGSMIRTWKRRWFVLRRGILPISSEEVTQLRASSPLEEAIDEGEEDDKGSIADDIGDDEVSKNYLHRTSIRATLYYFVSPQDTVPKGSIPITSSCSSSTRILGNTSYDLERSGGKPNCFSFRSIGHGYYFIADTEEDMLMWTRAFKEL